MMNGRPLIVLPAVDKCVAKKLKAQSAESFDRRHLSLIRESSVLAHARAYPAKEVELREQMVRDKTKQLGRNQNLSVSDTRLCIRRLPPVVDAKILKVFIKAALTASNAPRTRIVQVKVVCDPEDRRHRSRGFAFCQLDSATAALSLVRHLTANPSQWTSLCHGRIPVIEFAIEKSAVVASRQARLEGKNK